MIAILMIYCCLLAAFIALRVSVNRRSFGSAHRFFFERHDRPRSFDHAFGLLIGTLFVLWLLQTSHTLGFTRDEGFYFDAARSYANWFETALSPEPKARELAFTQGFIDSHWSQNSEHPSLMKSAFGLSWLYLYREWPTAFVTLFSRNVVTGFIAPAFTHLGVMIPKLFAEESLSFRFPSMITGGLILYVTYLFGVELFGRAAGLFAALFFAVLPRPFFDAHLACFDEAAVLAWLATAYTFYRGLRSMRVAVVAGVVWGLALLTKHNSWFLPIVFVVHYAWIVIAHLRKHPDDSPGFLRAKRSAWLSPFGYDLRGLSIPWPFLFMAVLGPPIFVYGWPHLWFDTASRIDAYFSFHMHHDYYNIEYLHHTYFDKPYPFSMVYVLILATVPFGILVAMFFGAISNGREILDSLFATNTIRSNRLQPIFFLFINMNVPALLIALPWIPHFGGTKHWHASYPFLCLFAAAGVVWAARSIARALREKQFFRNQRGYHFALAGTSIAIFGTLFGPALDSTIHSHPHGLSDYTPIVGGPAGGADLGLNRGFWGYETGAIVDWLNLHFPNGARVYPDDTATSAFEQLRADNRLHGNIEQEWFSIANCDVAVIEHEQHMDEVEHQIWVAFGTIDPKYVVTLEGVPTLTVYVNPKSRKFVP